MLSKYVLFGINFILKLIYYTTILQPYSEIYEATQDNAYFVVKF